MTNIPTTLYTDGGCITKNPSPLGGTWAFLALSDTQEILYKRSGVITPDDLGIKTISNNVTEMLAAIRALQSVPPTWNGVLYTDSMVTLHRLNGGKNLKGLPHELRLVLLQLRRQKRWRVVLVKGHPTQEQLDNGWAGGRPVSKFNVLCDELCTKAAKKFLANESLR